jgi:hypothetical protein
VFVIRVGATAGPCTPTPDAEAGRRASRPRMPGSCRAAATRDVSDGNSGRCRIRIQGSLQHRGVVDDRGRRRAARPTRAGHPAHEALRESLRRNRRRVDAAGSCTGCRDRAGSPAAPAPFDQVVHASAVSRPEWIFTVSGTRAAPSSGATPVQGRRPLLAGTTGVKGPQGASRASPPPA